MKTETVDIATLNPDPANVRKHGPRNLDTIKASLKKFGQQKPIVVDADGVVVAGNGTLDAARALGWDKLEVVRTELTGTDATAYAIADNRTAELAEWDHEALGKMLSTIDFDYESAGFTNSDLESLLPPPEIVEDDVPDKPVKPITKPGDLWLLGDHRVLCGDATKAEEVSRATAGFSEAVVAFTSPPYSDQRTYGKDAAPDVSDLTGIFVAAGSLCDMWCVNLGMSRKNGYINRYWDDWIAAAGLCGFGLLSWNVWNRPGNGYSVGNLTAMFPISHEWVFVMGAKAEKLIPTIPNKHSGYVSSTNRNDSGKMSDSKKMKLRTHRELGTVFECNTVANNLEHPACFPVEFAAAYIKSFDRQTVYDPFLGSGTTLIAAEQLNRKCYGLEIDPGYCDVIVKRWENLTGKKAVLDG